MSDPEAKRLEQLWSGHFGNAYTDRNRKAGENRAPFWQAVLTELPVRRVLEVGCNIGGNLYWAAQMLWPNNLFGIDVNERALQELQMSVPGVNAVRSLARQLPFRDGSFDLVFTMGVLIHQPDSALPLVMAEIVRCSRLYVLCGEYWAPEPAEVPYRGQRGALIKRDFGRKYVEGFPQLSLCKQGFLSYEEGWSDVTYWVLKKS